MLKLIFVHPLSKNSNDDYVYELFFTDDIEVVWGNDWEYKPALNCNIQVPDKSIYNEIKIIKTKMLLDVAQQNSCFSMQDCMDGIIPIAWENLDECDEYPEEGRVVLPFGICKENVEKILSIRNIFLE